VPKYARYGVGVAKRPLSPFRSVAVDPVEVPIGTMLYIAELDGLTMPGRGSYGGFVHDGCVLADDRGGGVKGHQIDFFTARRHHYTAFDRRHRLKSVTVYDGKGRCMRKGRRVVAAANRNSI
jgi:3D (Asp-Asp-Asp) domain-containing protein